VGERDSASANQFLVRAAVGPAGLIIEGPMGIGKTTLWSAAIEQARELEFLVLSARAVEAESVLAFAAVADMLAELDPAAVDALSPVQRVAVDRVLLNERADGRPTDQRVAAAAFASIVAYLAGRTPVLLAVDDAQWLDSSSRAVLGYAARRLTGPVGVVLTERTSSDRDSVAMSWLQVRGDGVATIKLEPMDSADVHEMIVTRLNRSFPRATLTRIHEISGGNPFFALELARSIDVDAPRQGQELTLSPTLAEVTRLRLTHLNSETMAPLLAASCVANPTVDLIAAATGLSAEDVVHILEPAEIDGVVTIEGNRVRFEHPLLAHGVYTQASAPQRRRMHRVLAGIETHPELKARHLALATTSSDPETLKALDAAAEAATARGAPAAAAELFELGIERGGDEPMRRFRAAASLLGAGDAIRGRDMLEPALPDLPPGPMRAAALNLLAGLCVYTNGYVEATGYLLEALPHAAGNPMLRVQTLLMLSFTQINDGAFDESLSNAAMAVAEADKLGIPPLTSQVLSMWVMVNSICGNGVDESANTRALDTEDHTLNAPIVFRASANNAQLLAWKGDLDAARVQLNEVRRRCEERGAESDLLFVAVQRVLIEIWNGELGDADEIARDAVARAEQVGGDQSELIATTVLTAVSAYRGSQDDVREHARRALKAAERCGAHRVAEWPTMMLGFLETSLGNYAQALAVLRDMVTKFPSTPTGTEIITATFIPDAVEALVGLGRAAEAEPLIAALEDNGARLDRPWMIAVGSRCRAMVLAASGDVGGALTAARRAMTAHQRLPMPFEQARTELVMGRLLRRSRRKGAAQVLSAAVETFEQLGAAIWAARARDELARTATTRAGGDELTGGERRVAERAAAGLSNREIAAELQLSVKTVETHLGSVFRKLRIRSRSQVASRLTAEEFARRAAPREAATSE
jgi:DNA-binding CsgD family transcriptional regulator